jgi:P-type Ca2+ transporter type 2B
MNGSGLAIVVAVGPNSRNGILRKTLEIEPEVTPLQVKLGHLADQIGKIGVTGAVLTFAGCMLRLVVQCMYHEEMSFFSMETLQEVLNYFILSITIIVMAVPEGLPMAVAIALSFSVDAMR